MEQNASSPDYMHSVFGGFSSFDDSLQDIDPVGIPCHQPLDYPENLIYNFDTMNPAPYPNEHLPYADVQGGFSTFIPCPHVSIDKAQRGWNVLVFVLRWWFSIKRIVARRTRDRELPRYCE